MNSDFYISFMVQDMFCSLAALISLFSFAVYVCNCILINAFIYIYKYIFFCDVCVKSKTKSQRNSVVLFMYSSIKILFCTYVLSPSSENFAFVVEMFAGGNGERLH